LLAHFSDLKPSIMNTHLLLWEFFPLSELLLNKENAIICFSPDAKWKAKSAVILLVLCLLRNLVCSHVAIHIRTIAMVG
jgi:hypothetical protein